MVKLKRLTPGVAKGLAERIKKETVAGERRDALLYRYLVSPEFVPRDTDFMRSAIELKDKHSGLPVQWVFNRPQKLVFYTRERRRRFNNPVRDAILKARKWGMSTGMVAEAIALAARTPYLPMAIIGKADDLTRELLDAARFIADRLPVRLPRKYENRSNIYFGKPLESYIDIYTAKTKEPVRGGTYRSIHCTETAFWEQVEKKIISVHNAVADTGPTQISHETTANGIENWWYNFWWKAKRGESDFWAWFFPWWFDPEFDYCDDVTHKECEELMETLSPEETVLLADGVELGQLQWRRRKIRNDFFDDDRLFNQEFPAKPEDAFLASGLPTFNPEAISKAIHKCHEPVWQGHIFYKGYNEVSKLGSYELVKDTRGPLCIYRQPEEYHSYCMGIDTGHGIKDGDFSCVDVGDADTGEQVAVWHGIETPPEFAKATAALGWYYGNAYALPEMEGPGEHTQMCMAAAGYHMIGSRVSLDSRGKPRTKKMGWSTNVQTRVTMINEFVKWLAQDDPGFRSRELLRQAATMRLAENGRHEVPKVQHDDRLFAAMIRLMAHMDMVVTGMQKQKEEERPLTRDQRHWKRIEDLDDPKKRELKEYEEIPWWEAIAE
jgi:hypothetical protein